VTRLEYLGADRLIYGVLEGRFADAKVIARLPYTVTTIVEPGQRYDFTVPEHELKFFDRETGLRTAPRAL
jgi:multiple sugar transport system ATP-binding protein